MTLAPAPHPDRPSSDGPSPPDARLEAEPVTPSAISWLLFVLISCIGWVCFFVFNRTTVRRAQQPGPRRNILYVSNHQSTVDTLLIGLSACHPHVWIRPRQLPWSLAAAEVYFRTPVTAWFASRLRCLPVRRDRRDPVALRRLLRVLRGGTAIYFPEGRRSQTGTLGEAVESVGWIALRTGAHVVPVAIDGMNEVVRFERFELRFFRRIGVSIGPELDLSAHRDRAPSRATAREVTALIMAAIARELVVAREARGRQGDGARSAS